ncbi:MAG: response regulator [Elusimicrobia bacterium]|nr:response regulator [Elusimicrobiota bacterium]
MPDKKILIVDDEPDVRFVLRTALERAGYSIDEAKDGLEALAKIAQALPDAILLDVMMPKMDGFSVHQKLKENPAWASVPVVIITGKGYMKEFMELRQDLAVAAYLEKPFPVSMIIGKLQDIFGNG